MSKGDQGLGVPIKVLCGTHGNEALGPGLHERLLQEPIQGVQSRIAHPKAVGGGVRYLGQVGQLQAHYPGDPFGDPEDRAAWENMRWLGNDAGSESVLVFDIHNTAVSGLTAFSVGRRALKSAVVGAWTLGYDKCFVARDPFRLAVPNAALLENAVLNEADQALAVKRLYLGLGELTLRNVAELESQYEEMTANIWFYNKHQILTRTAGGGLAEGLSALEEVKAGDAFTPIELPGELRELLGIPADTEVLNESWGHKNMSPVQPDLGRTRDGLPRRLCFGGYFLPIDPPTVDGNWVRFAGELGV